jgi:hypothetical protein
VLFADIAGFTAWCSPREPSEVFHLLEAIFYVFDTLAKSLGVYKIETIGDCYVGTYILIIVHRMKYLEGWFELYELAGFFAKNLWHSQKTLDHLFVSLSF